MKSDSYSTDDKICALATPVGLGAISIIRLSGKGCIESVSQCFSRPQALLNSEGGRVHHGWIRWESSLIDEVLITIFRAPESYTGEDCAEISCHGGFIVFENIMKILRKLSFRDASAGEFSFRAFSNGKMDLTRSEAVRDIIEARSDRARALATRHLAGSLENAINRIKDNLVSQAAISSLALDYPEDEVDNIPFNLALIGECRDSLQELLSTWRTGSICQRGIEVVLAGPTNAGKSSLFNLFLRQERSIVTDRPGTTRDWVQANISLGGMALQLIDTAGLRMDSRDLIEQEGIRRTHKLIKSSDIVLVIADASLGKHEALKLENIIRNISEKSETGSAGTEPENPFRNQNRLIRVWNKSDLTPKIPDGWIPVSTLLGKGFGKLEAAINKRLESYLEPGEKDAPIVSSARQKGLLEEAVTALGRVLEAGKATRTATIPYDLMAEDLHDALNFLGEITGTITRTDVLNTVFSRFCVGK